MVFSLSELGIDGHTVLRILCGAFLLPHTVAKLMHTDRAANFFAKTGLFGPYARPAVLTVATSELIAAVGMITGLFPRIGALIAVGILAGAGVAIVRIHGLKWRWQYPGIEYMVFWSCMCLAVNFLPF